MSSLHHDPSNDESFLAHYRAARDGTAAPTPSPEPGAIPPAAAPAQSTAPAGPPFNSAGELLEEAMRLGLASEREFDLLRRARGYTEQTEQGRRFVPPEPHAARVLAGAIEYRQRFSRAQAAGWAPDTCRSYAAGEFTEKDLNL